MALMALLLFSGIISGLGGLENGLFSLAPETASTRNAYAYWKYGPPSDPNFFPIAVWLQQPKNARRYQQAGINLYVGLWKGPTEEQLTALRQANMPVICEQNEIGLAHRDDPIIVGWMHPDEPDNAQLAGKDEAGHPIYGPCVPPTEVVVSYRRLAAADPNRPILLNLGQGVANDLWRGRGAGAHSDDYYTYVKGGDIVSFDVYPVAGLSRPDLLWYVAKGISRLGHWVQWNSSTSTAGPKIIWNCIECSRISNEKMKPTPHQVRAEVWMALIHGSTGLIYFVHQFKPSFNEWALLDDPEMLAAVTDINRQIHELAPVLNSPMLRQVAAVKSENLEVPIALMAKRYTGAIYLFAVAMREAPTKGIFQVNGLPGESKVEVLGEGRTIPVRDGRFEDKFQPYEVHLYRIQ